MSIAIAKASLEVIVDENLVENARVVGSYMREKISKINSPLLKEVRGRGLINTVELNSNSHITATDLSNIM